MADSGFFASLPRRQTQQSIVSVRPSCPAVELYIAVLDAHTLPRSTSGTSSCSTTQQNSMMPTTSESSLRPLRR